MLSNKKVIFYDTFTIKSERWKEDAFSFYHNKSYHMYPRNFSNDFSWVSLHTSYQFRNFLYEAEAEWLDGRTNIGYGLAFRASDLENTYVFSITKNKYYSLGMLKKGKFVFISNWEESDLIKDKKNHLAVACINNCITAYINDNTVTTICDSTFGKGYFGFFSSANIHSCYNKVKISEIEEDILRLI
jgi:hypothetical protein